MPSTAHVTFAPTASPGETWRDLKKLGYELDKDKMLVRTKAEAASA